MSSNKSKQAGRASLLAQLFGVDLRSLALFRVAIAVVVLVDLVVRADDLTALYTDVGVLPRSDSQLFARWKGESLRSLSAPSTLQPFARTSSRAAASNAASSAAGRKSPSSHPDQERASSAS